MEQAKQYLIDSIKKRVRQETNLQSRTVRPQEASTSIGHCLVCTDDLVIGRIWGYDCGHYRETQLL